MNQQQTLQNQRHALTCTLEQAHAEHAALTAKLAESPDDFDLLDEAFNAQQRIDATAARIALFDEAAGTHLTRSAKATRIATAVAARDEAVDLAAQRVDVAKRIDAALAELQTAISEYAALNEQTAHAAKTSIKSASERASLDGVQRAVQAARSGIGDPISTALIRSDLEKIAPGALTFAGRAGSATVEDVAKLAGDRLATLLDAALRGV